jgi:hypothetical protein
MHAVIFEKVRVSRDRAEVIDRDDLDILSLGVMRRAQDQPADAAKAVDRYPYRHLCLRLDSPH